MHGDRADDVLHRRLRDVQEARRGCLFVGSRVFFSSDAFAAHRILGPLEALLQQNSEMYEKYCDDAAGAKK